MYSPRQLENPAEKKNAWMMVSTCAHGLADCVLLGREGPCTSYSGSALCAVTGKIRSTRHSCNVYGSMEYCQGFMSLSIQGCELRNLRMEHLPLQGLCQLFVLQLEKLATTK